MKRAFAVFLAAVMVLSCAGCSDKPYESVSDTGESTSESTEAVTSEEVESPDISKEIQTTESTDIAAESSEQTAETAETAETAPPVSGEQTKPVTYPSPEEGHVFVDFEYIEHYSGITDLEKCQSWYEDAAAILKKSDIYAESNERFRAEDIANTKVSAAEYNGVMPSETASDYIGEDGNIQPQFNRAYVEDFNNDGWDEAIVLLDIPVYDSTFSVPWDIYTVAVYKDVNSSKVLESYFIITEISLLDYGCAKQLVIGCAGAVGAGSHTEIYGVPKYQIETLYSFRGSFDKVDCFLSAFGWQSSGDFMYYDTAAGEYRAILGRDMYIDEAFAMDTANSLDESKREFNKVVVIGEKYYLFVLSPMHTGDAYTYENGAFIYCGEDVPIRDSGGYQTNRVEDINYDEAVASMLTPEEAGRRESEMLEHFELIQISPDNVFIDFELIYDYHGETDPTKCAELVALAEEAVFSSEMYAEASAALSPEKAEEIITDGKEIDTSLFFDDNGRLVPVFSELFSEDFDGNGTMEHFAVLRLPIRPYGSGTSYYVRDILVYISDSGNAEMITFYNSFYAYLIDYGAFRQLIAGGSGLGVETGAEIYGVIEERPTKLVGFRGGYYKWECFLTGYGWQSGGGMMYYDTVAQEYRTVAGDLLDMDEVYAMDSTGELPERSPFNVKEITLVGGKYYIVWSGWMDSGTVFTYENGAFVPVPEECYVRLPGFITDKAVKIEDIEAAIASMLTPEEALKQKQAEHLPSEGHIFVDFSYIKDYEGTTDITECGKWYSMALSLLKSEKDYKRFNDLLKNEDLSDIEYFKTPFTPDITDYLDENGNIQPILSGAFIDDFDKNGQDECFLLLDIPYYVENSDYWITRSYLYYGNGKGIKYLNDFSNIWEISMLDYGVCRQFIIRAYGTMGADEAALIYGVTDGEVVEHYAFRGGFTKVDCFINASGWMGFGDFMYYDTVRQQ